jgi:hypothetical protein
MKVIQTGYLEEARILDAWRRAGLSMDFVHAEALYESLRSSLNPHLTAEVITCIAYPDDLGFEGEEGQSSIFPLSVAINLASEIKELPPQCAMQDGRKWHSVPFVIIPGVEFDFESLNEKLPQGIISVPFPGQLEKAAHDIRKIVTEYRQRILDEFDNLGFLVLYDNGRFRIGPALTRRDEVEGKYYYGPADRADRSTRYDTVDRDLYGIQYEIELFEALLNKPSTIEPELQRFFEEHPHFLSATNSTKPLPHVRLEDSLGKVLVPDFILRPIVASQRDSKWEVLDLKRPQAKLLVGKRTRARFSQEVVAAITQLRDYGDYFQNPANSDTVMKLLGHRLRHPRLGVLIGRLPKGNEVESLEVEQSRQPYVRITTYDEILEQQRQLL